MPVPKRVAAALEAGNTDPTWLPIRNSGSVGCTLSNCSNGQHGHWAIDFVGKPGDSVYSAGSGTAYIGSNSYACASSTGKESAGAWVYVDHGGGFVSRYHHLSSIAIKNGQPVTNQTRIGAMGGSGSYRCVSTYLHYEVRSGGIHGTRINPGQLAACRGQQYLTFPAAWGWSSWNSVPRHKRAASSEAQTCGPDLAPPPKVPDASATSRGGGLKVSWQTSSTQRRGERAGVTSAMIKYERYAPSVKRYSPAVYLSVAEASGTRILPGIQYGANYRIQVAVRNGTGYSPWSRTTVLRAAKLPTKPRLRYVRSVGAGVSYGWWKAPDYRSTISRFTVKYQCRKSSVSASGGYRTAKQRVASGRSYYLRIAPLPIGQRCRFAIRATNAAGSSGFSRWAVVSVR